MQKLLILPLILFFTASVAQAQIDRLVEYDKGIQYWRPYSQAGINVFEPGKEDTLSVYQGLKVRIGGAFTQQFQAVSHSNDADAVFSDPNRPSFNRNLLKDIGPGFNLAAANLNADVQLGPGIRLNLITYLSSRHHPEAWVKGGYIQIDEMPFLNSDAIDNVMHYLRLKVGHMEINYGDAHFRRTDNGFAMHNPFVGNYIMDAFTTEVGGELYFFHNGIIAMAAASGGQLNPSVTNSGVIKPSVYGKIGFDKELSDDFRLRITASAYHASEAGGSGNSLFSGDRAGSRYYFVMENTDASAAAQFSSGRINPGMRNRVTAMAINPFVKFMGFELFGNFEQVRGGLSSENNDRTVNQMGIDLLYRIGANENFYVGGRYNSVTGDLGGANNEANISRIQAGGGWFINQFILAKLEYVNQSYEGFSSTDIRRGGEFNGIMVEGVVAF